MDKNADIDIAELRQQAENERIRDFLAEVKGEAPLKQDEKDIEVLKILNANLNFLREAKPYERSELARRYTVTITELEKVIAYFRVYVTGDT